MKEIKFCGVGVSSGEKIFSNSIKFEEVEGADVSFPYLRDEKGDWIEVLRETLKYCIKEDTDDDVYESLGWWDK